MTLQPESVDAGRAEALADIKAGHCRLFWGIRGAWGRHLSEIMKTRFGVEVIATSCFVWDELKSFRVGYNAEIKAHVDCTFGAGSFDKAVQETEDFRKQLYDQWVALNELA